MTNPDISKIIGEQWNKAPFEVKQEWKKLAEVRVGLAWIYEDCRTLTLH